MTAMWGHASCVRKFSLCFPGAAESVNRSFETRPSCWTLQSDNRAGSLAIYGTSRLFMGAQSCRCLAGVAHSAVLLPVTEEFSVAANRSFGFSNYPSNRLSGAVHTYNVRRFAVYSKIYLFPEVSGLFNKAACGKNEPRINGARPTFRTLGNSSILSHSHLGDANHTTNQGPDENENSVAQQKSRAFEIWSAKKLKEQGSVALSVLEEMRQVFAPSSASLGRSQPVTSEEQISSDKLLELATDEFTGGFIRERKKEALPIRSFGNGKLARESRSIASFRVNKTPSKIRPQEFSSSQGNLAMDGVTDAATTNDSGPLLVKRSTTLPDKWDGPAGTVVLIDKPSGCSSFSVCAKLRSTTGIRKVGHAGTLDPLATGLLIVCLGNATKLADSYQAMTKVYSGTLRLGELTPSLDADTKVTETLPWEHIQDTDLEKARHAFIGDILQAPPMFSAIKMQGERLYDKARRGEEVVIPPRKISVNEFQLERSPENRQDVHFRIVCSKGTYVRTLCADLARSLNSYAHLTALRRLKIGTYCVSDAWPVDELVKEYSEHRGIAAFK